ncbi:hypothetical protein [Thalassobaculum sp.]|uniref:hypothetical protein n=1 Tax=Thalassobaculum sp. TaxID=2022740 RepID=UPI0032EF3A1A
MTPKGIGNPIALLCDLLAEGDQRISAEAIGGRNAPEAIALSEAGLIVPDGVIDTTICNACDEVHLAEIDTDPDSGGYSWLCPDAGFVAADCDIIAAYAVSMQRLATAVSDALSETFGRCRWRMRRLDDTSAWMLGVWSIGSASTIVVLARGLAASAEAQRVRQALLRLPRNDAGLVITIGGLEGLEPPPRFASAPLDAIAFIEGSALLVDAQVIDRSVAPHLFESLHARGGRPGYAMQVKEILTRLDQRGELPKSGTGLAGIVRREWTKIYPNEEPPAPSTVRNHIAVWRAR